MSISQVLWLVYKLTIYCLRDHVSTVRKLPKDFPAAGKWQIEFQKPRGCRYPGPFYPRVMSLNEGVSAGSVVAAMLAIGCDAEAIFKLTPWLC